MELLLLFIGVVIAAALLIWRTTTQKSYWVRNRDRPRQQLQGRSANRPPGPNLKDMLD